MSKRTRTSRRREAAAEATPEPSAPQDLPGMTGPGVSQVKIESVEKAAKKYARLKSELADLRDKVGAARVMLSEAIHENIEQIGYGPDGNVTYKYENMMVVLKKGKELITVRDVAGSSTSGEDSE